MTTCEFCGQVILDGKECTCDGAVAERKKTKQDPAGNRTFIRNIR